MKEKKNAKKTRLTQRKRTSKHGGGKRAPPLLDVPTEHARDASAETQRSDSSVQ